MISILKFGIIYRLNVKNQHYRFDYIIPVKCFTENITKECIVAIVRRFRTMNDFWKKLVRTLFLRIGIRTVESRIRNSEFGLWKIKYFTHEYFELWNNLQALFWYGISYSDFLLNSISNLKLSYSYISKFRIWNMESGISNSELEYSN